MACAWRVRGACACRVCVHACAHACACARTCAHGCSHDCAGTHDCLLPFFRISVVRGPQCPVYTGRFDPEPQAIGRSATAPQHRSAARLHTYLHSHTHTRSLACSHARSHTRSLARIHTRSHTRLNSRPSNRTKHPCLYLVLRQAGPCVAWVVLHAAQQNPWSCDWFLAHHTRDTRETRNAQALTYVHL